MGIDPGVSHPGGEMVSHNTTDARCMGLTTLDKQRATLKLKVNIGPIYPPIVEKILQKTISGESYPHESQY